MMIKIFRRKKNSSFSEPSYSSVVSSHNLPIYTSVFRGKSLVSGEWIYGDFYREMGEKTAYYIQPIFRNALPHLIDPDTLGRFTGRVTDKGQKIYEGDIVDVTLRQTRMGRHLVVWDHEYCEFVLKRFGREEGTLTFAMPMTLHVVGNAYDDHKMFLKMVSPPSRSIPSRSKIKR